MSKERNESKEQTMKQLNVGSVATAKDHTDFQPIFQHHSVISAVPKQTRNYCSTKVLNTSSRAQSNAARVTLNVSRVR